MRFTATTRPSKTPCLQAVEDGTVTLIGATTENPSFEVISALLSRTKVLTLQPLSEVEIATILRRALADDGSRTGLAAARDRSGRARSARDGLGGRCAVALTALESAVQATPPAPTAFATSTARSWSRPWGEPASGTTSGARTIST